ncbi:hypothetical protein LINPERHAP2_LOCUS33102 [Linum perenne]
MSSSYTKSSVSFDGAGSFSSTGYNLEYRSLTDDAWYTVCAIFDGKSLTVKYQGFQDDEDDLFEPHRFISLDEIEELKSRFRPVSHQLQDCECLGLTRGTAVCVSHSFDGNDNIFFDATIDEVVRKKHSFVNGNERCMCRFQVVLTHGPAKGELHTKLIENICVVQSDSELDPAVASFLEVARRYNEGKVDIKVESGDELDIFHDSSIETESSGDDADIGGHYALLIDNMEEGISPSTLEQFIKDQISVLVEAHALESLFHEKRIRAVILVNSEHKYQQLCSFLDSPAHFVTSWTGRPLVVTDKNLGFSQSNYAQRKWQHTSDEIEEERGLKVVRSGSDAYRRAMELRELFIEFKEHQNTMYGTLSKEEAKIKQRFLSV